MNTQNTAAQLVWIRLKCEIGRDNFHLMLLQVHDGKVAEIAPFVPTGTPIMVLDTFL